MVGGETKSAVPMEISLIPTDKFKYLFDAFLCVTFWGFLPLTFHFIFYNYKDNLPP